MVTDNLVIFFITFTNFITYIHKMFCHRYRLPLGVCKW